MNTKTTTNCLTHYKNTGNDTGGGCDENIVFRTKNKRAQARFLLTWRFNSIIICVAYSLSNGFWIIDLARFTYGWSGSLEKDSEDLLVCDENGETFYGDLLENVRETTWVEF